MPPAFFLPPGEPGGIAAAMRGGRSIRPSATAISRALAGDRANVRERGLSRPPAAARRPRRTVRQPSYSRATPPL
jgi:hypothetical protein